MLIQRICANNQSRKFNLDILVKWRSSWSTTVGLEIHAQLASQSKLFSNAQTGFTAPINSSVNLFDASIPGTLPSLNKFCVELAVRTSIALSCKVNAVSAFDRKHYFYADLPCGYQITQQRKPLAENGEIHFYVYTPGIHKSPYRKACKLKQVQLEQDSGKSLHDAMKGNSLIDLNRAGVGLMEFVFEPELSDGEEAAALVKELIIILKRLRSCSCKMEEGALRVDANVSVSKDPSQLGTRTEIKNIFSIRAVANAIKYESERQIKLLEEGGVVLNETRSWDSQSKATVSMRDKEAKQDYRFMPEPNLPPLRICVDENVDTVPEGVLDARYISGEMPDLPECSRQYLMNTHNLSEIYSITLVNQPILFDTFKIVMDESSSRDAKLVWNMLMVQALSVLHTNNIELDDCPIASINVGEIIDLIQSGKIDLETGKNILEMKVKGSKSSACDIIEEKKWYLVSDPSRIEEICHELIKRNPKAVKKYLKGKDKALQTVINDALKISTEKINMSMIAKRLREILQEEMKSNDTVKR